KPPAEECCFVRRAGLCFARLPILRNTDKQTANYHKDPTKHPSIAAVRCRRKSKQKTDIYLT
ncbi:hypothetical protein NEUTE2DRAFT_103683, partial [Neurospora tetrasperma FGSC 2509]